MDYSVRLLQLKRDDSLVDKVCSGLMEGKYWAILGPRFFGKTTLLRQIEERLKKEAGLRCLYVSLRRYSGFPRLKYYRKFYKDIAKALKIKPKETPRITTREILDNILHQIEGRLIILFSGIESLNEDLARGLLLSLRRCYDQRSFDETYHKLGAVVSGSINLARLSRGRASPFNIAEIIFLNGLSEEEGEGFIERLAGKKVSEVVKGHLLKLTGGHPYLIEAILQLVEGEDIDGAVNSFVKKGIEDPLLKTIIKNLERTGETFRVFKEIRNGRTPKLSDTSLPTEPEITGLFKRTDNYTYEISNEVFEKFLKEYFDNQRLGDLFLLYGDWDSAKEFYKKEGTNVSKRGTQRKDVIDAFGRVMMREKDFSRVKSLVIEGARYLMDFERAELLRRDELSIDEYNDSNVIYRAISHKRVAFGEDSLAVPLFWGENEVRWILLIKGEVVDIDEELLDTFRINAGLGLENAYFMKELAAREVAIEIAVQSLEERDPYTKGHSVKVAKFCRLVVDKLDEDTIRKETFMNKKEFKELVYLAGLLHDVGKIGIKENVLLKEGSLDDKEWLEMTTHPYSSKEIIRVDDERFGKISEIILHHHEKINGSGYPYGLKGKDIPLGSRIIAIADSFDAMTSNRIYRRAMQVEMALAEIRILSSEGSPQYDRRVCDAFLSAIKDEPREFGMGELERDIDVVLDKVYDKNLLLSKDYLNDLLKEILKEIKLKSERTISIMMLSLDREIDEENKISLLHQIKKKLPKSALFGNYANNRYIILLDERAKDAYVKAEIIKRSKYKIKEYKDKEEIPREFKGINIGIYEPLSSDKDRGLEPDEIYQKVEGAHQKALETKKTIIYRS